MVLEFCYTLVRRTLIMPQCTCAWCLHWIPGVSLSWLSYYSTGNILCKLCCVVLLVACMCFLILIFTDLFRAMPAWATLAHTHVGAVRTPSCNAFWKIPLRSRKLAISSGRTQPFSPQFEYIFGVSHGFSALLPLLSSKIHSLFPFPPLSAFEVKRMLA